MHRASRRDWADNRSLVTIVGSCRDTIANGADMLVERTGSVRKHSESEIHKSVGQYDIQSR